MGTQRTAIGDQPVQAVFNAVELGGTPLGGSSGNVANAAATVTLAAVAGRRNYLGGFDLTFAGATAASIVLMTVTGLAGGTRTYVVAVPAGAVLAGQPLVVNFDRALPASGPNVAIAVSCPALGVGNTNACVNVHGFSVDSPAA